MSSHNLSKLLTRCTILLAITLSPSISIATLSASGELTIGQWGSMPNDPSNINAQHALSWSAAIAPGHDGKADWIHLDQGKYGLGGPFDISTSDTEDMTKSSGSVEGGFSNPVAVLNPITFYPVTIKSSSETDKIENNIYASNYSAYLLEMRPDNYQFIWTIPVTYTININGIHADSRVRITNGNEILKNIVFSDPGSYSDSFSLDIDFYSDVQNVGHFISFYLYTNAGLIPEPPSWGLFAISLAGFYCWSLVVARSNRENNRGQTTGV